MLQSSSLLYLAMVGLVGQTFASPISNKVSTSIPLHRRLSPRSGGLSDLDSRIAQHQAIKARYGIPFEDEDVQASRRLLRKRASSASLPIAGTDQTFYGSLSVGTPAFTYEVVLDTGSSDLVMMIPGVDRDGACVGNCVITGQLYPALNGSTSAVALNRTTNLVYGGGIAAGYLVNDTVTMGGFTSVQTIAACNNVTSLTSSSDETGLIGLAFESLSGTGSRPFMQGLYESGQLSEPLFAFAPAPLDLKDVGAYQDTVPGGFLDIGTTNSTLFTGEIGYTGLTGGKGRYWEIPLDSFQVQGVDVNISTPNAVIDSGTNSLAIPTLAAEKIYAAIADSKLIAGTGGLYEYPCKTNVSLTLTFNGVQYTTAPKFFNGGVSPGRKETHCIGAVSALGGTSAEAMTTYVIGTPFIMNFYSVFRFDPPSVGFATITNSSALTSGGIPRSNGTASANVTTTAASNAPSTTGLSKSSASQLSARGSVLGAFVGLAITAGAFVVAA
ncbi:BQ2448_7762 [Microbotryum intermedium]|uniref:BQ2448_7762 protein n=1 Tax=Microbotryum intermedium TaxID=269621 RepID=A0A238FRZ7_9BASI|nr:BQ2448_7762 [Microbotryum intermedium]